MQPHIHFVLGGARSGKSRLAEQYARATKRPVIYVATAEAKDPEMSSRIAKHKLHRPTEWTIVEQPLALADAIQAAAGTHACILVDCLTLWLSNCLCANAETPYATRKHAFIQAIAYAKAQGCVVILVSNEVGHGIVPLGALSRSFVDESGWLHQDVARVADSVVFVMAGLPLTMKRTLEECQ